MCNKCKGLKSSLVNTQENWSWAKPTSLKLQLRLLSELALSEGVAISGFSTLQYSGPVDGGKNRHQHPQQGTYKETEYVGLL